MKLSHNNPKISISTLEKFRPKQNALNPQWLQFIRSRKQSQFNTLHKIRKNQLQTITKDNRLIFEKINAQTSQYGSCKMRHSKQNSLSNRNPSLQIKRLVKLQQTILWQTDHRQLLQPLQQQKTQALSVRSHNRQRRGPKIVENDLVIIE